MADREPESPDPADAPPEGEPMSMAAEPAKRPRWRQWKWLWFSLAVLVVAPTLVFAIWSWIALSYSYSTGNRAGFVQKFSKKGWICKTWEGELSMVNVPGQAQERWYFTVRDDSVASLITTAMGSKVALTYEEHPGVPTRCFGETRYYVVGVRKVQ
jgi:hypothetical protein